MVRNREPGSDLLVADVGGMGIMACRRLGQSTRAQWIIAADRRRSRLLCSCPCGQLKSDAVASKLASGGEERTYTTKHGTTADLKRTVIPLARSFERGWKTGVTAPGEAFAPAAIG